MKEEEGEENHPNNNNNNNNGPLLHTSLPAYLMTITIRSKLKNFVIWKSMNGFNVQQIEQMCRQSTEP